MTPPATPPPDRSPEKISPGKSAEPPGATPSKPPADFESYMQGGAPASKAPPGAPPSSGTTPMEAMHPTAFQATGAPNANTLVAQAKTAQDSLGTVGDKLKTQNLKFKRSQSHLLRNKLQDANSYVRAAGSKLGVEAPPMKTAPGATAIDRFINYVNDGQEQLIAVQQKLKELSSKGQQINPADMLYAQVKLNQAQQEIEYSSTLLSKVIDSLKSIINIQL